MSKGHVIIYIVQQGSAQDYLEVVKMGSDIYNIFQSNNNIKYIVVERVLYSGFLCNYDKL